MLFSDCIKKASEHLRGGGLVVFPTETVYGLGADAFNANAIARVYAEKGRPGDNPLILHIANIADFAKLAHNPPEYAFALAEAFWPGPLTMVARKNPNLPAWVGGHPSRTAETVGIRMPAHPIALELLRESNFPIAAPSANKAGRPSPTTLAHVLEDFPHSDIFPLDGGSAEVGLESTVVDITGDFPVILRPGAVTWREICTLIARECVTTPPFGHPSKEGNCPDNSPPWRGAAEGGGVVTSPPRSPGMKYKHYAPRAEMTLVSGEEENIAAYMRRECKKRSGEKIGLLVRDLEFFADVPQNAEVLVLGRCEKAVAQNLFARLREFDRLGVDAIFAEATAENGLGVAISDRMRKASEGRIVYV